MSTIIATDLTKRHGRGPATVLALDRVTLRVAAGEWLAIMGPSGCGKSTLLQVLGGLDEPDAGTVVVDGVALTGASESARARLRRRRIGVVFQQYNLIGELDVVGNVGLPLVLAGVPRRAARNRARRVLADLGLDDKRQAAPGDLSGGQQQRVAIARALIAKPAVLLADEPTGALDSGAAAGVADALAAARRAGQTVVMVTHDAAVAARADRVVHMRDGRLVDPQPTGAAA